ncbi:fluoride efflux transporter CrcB [Sphaerotilus sp.]|uniref:fluoride efflux transporter CrcB n=1 Tax=Sphaerotilus sp. TaxID=2093942 RepID=UPI0034E1E17C
MNATLVQAGSVALGASLGALLRWQAGVRLGFVVAGFPLGTLTVNVVGGFLIGLALVWFRLHPEDTNGRLLVVTGFLGGLTTFSSFSGESLVLLQSGNVLLALVHSAAHLLGALGAVALGWWLGRLVFVA